MRCCKASKGLAKGEMATGYPGQPQVRGELLEELVKDQSWDRSYFIEDFGTKCRRRGKKTADETKFGNIVNPVGEQKALGTGVTGTDCV